MVRSVCWSGDTEDYSDATFDVTMVNNIVELNISEGNKMSTVEFNAKTVEDIIDVLSEWLDTQPI